MKDWEIAGSYYLPRILCWRTRNKSLPVKLPKPNLRYLSLSEDNQWAVWKSSDCFYPEMIPEPDYSDSGDEAGSEGEDKQRFAPNQRLGLERLRDTAEVYVSNVNTNNPQPRKGPAKEAGSIFKVSSKQGVSKAASQIKKPPQKSPAPAKQRSKSPTESFKATGQQPSTKRSIPPTKRQGKSPERTKDVAPPKSKSPTKSMGVKATDRVKSADTKSADASKPKQGPKTKAFHEAEMERKAAGDTKAKRLGDKTASFQTSDKSSVDPSSDEDQLIKPRKPYVPNTEKQKLHKELKFSQKYGKLVSPKTELQLALERYAENKMRRELDAEEKTSLEKILEYQAKKIEMQEAMDPALERLQRPPSTWPNPKTEEFFRVHAKVVSSSILTHCFLSPTEDQPSSECSSGTFLQSDSSGSDI